MTSFLTQTYPWGVRIHKPKVYITLANLIPAALNTQAIVNYILTSLQSPTNENKMIEPTDIPKKSLDKLGLPVRSIQVGVNVLSTTKVILTPFAQDHALIGNLRVGSL